MSNEPKNGDYDDIIDLPHHVSTTRPQMSRLDRAAQFAPFAALTGYGAAIKETARLTDERAELGEYELMELNAGIALRNIPKWKLPISSQTNARMAARI